jgi:protein kinase A
VRNFIQQLVHWDPAQRLGNVTGGAAAVKAHPFFNGIDWSTLA